MDNNNDFKMPSPDSFSGAVHHEKHERLARESLRELLRFRDSLGKEIARLQASFGNHTESDTKILSYMQISTDLYDEAMEAMRAGQGNEGRIALIKFADSVQDLMAYVHKMRVH